MDSPDARLPTEVATQGPLASTPTTSRPAYGRAPASNPNFSSLPPLVTQIPARSAAVQRQLPYNKRLSTVSTAFGGLADSRPQSTVFPFFLSSLQYALVRDFAYQPENPLHYGPIPDVPSSATTTASEFNRQMADAIGRDRYGFTELDSGTSYFGLQIPSRKFGDGPPYAEDEDLLSPIVTTTRHKKNRSSVNEYDPNRSRVTSSLGRHAEAARDLDAQDVPSAHIVLSNPRDHLDEDTQATPELQDADSPSQSPSEVYDVDYFDGDESRYSKHYQFSIASPDEEYHGKAVALFDFQRENDNELPFVEGQVLYISYRHGEGWLVAQDPKSGESGLVPEQYVRLLKDIEGGLSGLKGDAMDPDSPTTFEVDTPTEYQNHQRTESGTDSRGRYYKPVVSSFSTSSKDLEPYHLSSSQQNTPTAPSRPTFESKEESAETLGTASFQQAVEDGAPPLPR